MSVQNIAPDVLALEFADVIDLRPGGVTVDRGVELYLTQRATRPSRVAALVGDGLETEDILPIVARVENDEALLDGLSAQERLSYNQARDAGYTEDQALAVGRWNDPALADAAAACRVANSFSGDTLVALADGTLATIADIQVGDQVLAYDFDTGETVAREVTATLPHEDWLLDAHLSDGSVMSVTEDHRFWSVTDSGWVELQDLDSTDQLLTPDGAMVTVDYLDWNAGADAPAWDLTVAEEHNFFVTAEHDGQPLLVHNSNRRGVACRYAFDADAAELLNAAEAAIGSPDVLGRLDGVLDELEKLDLADDFYGAIADVTDPVVLRRVLANSALGENVVAASISSGRVVQILGHPRFAVAARSTTVDNLATKIATRQDLSPSKIAGVRTADPDFAALGITDDVIIDRWWIYGGSKTQDQWLTAYVTVRKNGGSGSQFEVDALVAAGVDGDKIYFDFSAVDDPGPVAGRGGFEPDDATPVGVDGTKLDPTDPNQTLDYWTFTEAKNVNGRLSAGETSNVESQLLWLQRQPVGASGLSGQFDLYVAEGTTFTQPLLNAVATAREGGVEVNLFRDSPNGFDLDLDF